MTTAFGYPYPQTGQVLSLAELQKLGGRDDLYEFLKFYAFKDVFYKKYDFDEKALDTTNAWTVAAGATTTTWANTAAANGITRGIAGTTAATSGLVLQTAAKV